MQQRAWFEMAKNCVISKTSRTKVVGGVNPVKEILTTWATFQIKNAKLYIPVCTLSINDNIRFSEI